MRFARVAGPLVALVAACGTGQQTSPNGRPGGGTGGAGGGEAPPVCDICVQDSYVPCDGAGEPGTPIACEEACAPGLGCVACAPGARTCVGNEVHACTSDGQPNGDLVEVCDVGAGKTCSDGACGDACQVAEGQPSNLGCEFWAVQLDQQDALNDPSKSPWGIVLSNVGASPANVTIEINEAPQGQAPSTSVVQQLSIKPGDLAPVVLPNRWLDCGAMPNLYTAPGTCLSSNAFRITSSSPIVVYQFNTFTNAFSNDASLLLPTNALGKVHRVLGWPAGHSMNVGGIIDRSYVTIVGTKPNTLVKVHPSFRLRGNGAIPPTGPGGELQAILGPFDVLNLESDDATFAEVNDWGTDLSGSAVESSQPVAVFTGVESTSAPMTLDIPTAPGWTDDLTCCLDHLEDQLMPAESIGTHYVLTRSPVRSTSGWKEPDVVRFVGVAEPAQVTTSLPPPFDSFLIQPGEVKTTWAQDHVVVTSTKPVLVGQILISQAYVDGPFLGDPSLTVYPPLEQWRTEYVMLTPDSWTLNYVVVAAPQGHPPTLDGASVASCLTQPAGTVGTDTFQAHTCPVTPGVHRLSGDAPFGIVMYGYGSAGSYAVPGGADVKRIYDPPPIH